MTLRTSIDLLSRLPDEAPHAEIIPRRYILDRRHFPVFHHLHSTLYAIIMGKPC